MLEELKNKDCIVTEVYKSYNFGKRDCVTLKCNDEYYHILAYDITVIKSLNKSIKK